MSDDKRVTPAIEARRAAAEQRVDDALAHLDGVYSLLEDAAQALSRVEGMIPAWKALGVLQDHARRTRSKINAAATRLDKRGALVVDTHASTHGHDRGDTASKWPIDGAGAAGAMDAQTDARPQPLGRRQTDAGAHSPLENRQTDAGFPHRQQAPLAGGDQER